MKYSEEDFQRPCGCRSAGECSHNDFAWMHALNTCVDAFAAEMKRKLVKKFLEGRTGWDDPNWTNEQIMQALKEHVDKPNGDMVDVANFAMFRWNRG